jgi:hypothetical protein
MGDGIDPLAMKEFLKEHQTGFKLSAEDLPVRLSATTS